MKVCSDIELAAATCDTAGRPRRELMVDQRAVAAARRAQLDDTADALLHLDAVSFSFDDAAHQVRLQEDPRDDADGHAAHGVLAFFCEQ